MASDEVRVRAVVRGRVQRVGYRAFVLRHAASAGVRGTVRNNPDGTVEAVFQGARDHVDALVRLLQQGPPMARVERVDVEELQAGDDLPAMTMSA